MIPEMLEQHVIKSLNRSLIAFNEGLPEFFDEFGRDAMIFTADSPDPIKGREAYRRSYQPVLTSAKREKTILDRNVQIVGEKAVVTQTAQIKDADAVANVRQTLVYGETGEGLKVLHCHTALLTPECATDGALPTIQVVNEKIATVSSSLGVAQ